MIQVYPEYTACRSGFVLVTDNCDMKPVSGKYDTIKDAVEWGTKNGYIVNLYKDGKLVARKLPT